MIPSLVASPATRDADRSLLRLHGADAAFRPQSSVVVPVTSSPRSSSSSSSSSSLSSAAVAPYPSSSVLFTHPAVERPRHDEPRPLVRHVLAHESTTAMPSVSSRGPVSHVGRRRHGPRPRRSRNCKTLKQSHGRVPSRVHEACHWRGDWTTADSNRLERRPHRDDLHDRLAHMHSQLEYLQQRRTLYASALVETRNRAIAFAIDVATSFYSHFARGFDRASRPAQSATAEAFLRCAMADDVTCTEFVGVDTFLNQYEASTRGHTSIVLALQHVRVLDGEGTTDRIQIFAQGTVRLRICRATLARFFPSIVQDEELTQRLIGKEYMLQYDKVFHFRVSDGRIFQHETRIDFCASLLAMVGDPFLALRLVQASLMTKHGHWKIDDSVHEDRHALDGEVL